MSNQLTQSMQHLLLKQSVPLLILLGVVVVLGIFALWFGWHKDSEDVFEGGLVFLLVGIGLSVGVVYSAYSIPSGVQTAVNNADAQTTRINYIHHH